MKGVDLNLSVKKKKKKDIHGVANVHFVLREGKETLPAHALRTSVPSGKGLIIVAVFGQQ